MGSSIDTEFPRGLFHITDLPQTAVAVTTTRGGVADGLRVSRICLTPGDTSRPVIFRRPGAGAEYFQLNARRLDTSGTTVVHEFPFHFIDGLEILANGSVTDLGVTITFFDLP